MRTGTWVSLFEPRYLLFLPFAKSVYLLVQHLGFMQADAYLVMCNISSVCATVTLLVFYRFQRRVLLLTVANSIWGCLLLLFSYSFWRYAVEAEVYSLSNLLCIVVLYLVMRTVQQPRRLLKAVLAGSLGGLAVLLYKPNAIPLFFCFPFIFLFSRQWKPFLLYGFTGAITVVGIFYIVYTGFGITTPGFLPYMLSGATYTEGSPLMSLFVLGSDVVATNFLYGIPVIRTFIQQHFPAHVIAEEIFAAARNGGWNYAALGTVIALAGSILWALIRYRKSISRNRLLPVQILLLAWVVIYAAMLLVLDPTSPEPWMMLVMPLILLLAFGAQRMFYGGRPKVLWLIVVLLFLHNWIGGYRIIASKEGDYMAYSTGWLKTNTQPEDLVLSLGAGTTLAYIAYYTQARIGAPEQAFNRCLVLMDKTIRQGHKIYFTDDMVHPDPAIRYRDKTAYDSITAFLAQYRQYLVPVNPADMQHGRIYQFTFTGRLL
ncbi:DUF2723 domain-containing protein [Chitinophaga nivalis]|uniref:DUF2723 domain-containing protein n=1 Tax=Chitinophaga nivalis TaxID=2991709 RepID=A0ABT3ILQ0_9BACT|nr:DUF2723 domain-containing protein [Chitinophaga nivalis]MCW3484895.1 DUF2723 domain-containing protein [Chitinophaga nivalis]